MYGYNNPFANINFLLGLNGSLAAESRYWNAVATQGFLSGRFRVVPATAYPSGWYYGGGVGIYR